MDIIRKQAQRFGAESVYRTVTAVDLGSSPLTVTLDNGDVVEGNPDHATRIERHLVRDGGETVEATTRRRGGRRWSADKRETDGGVLVLSLLTG